MFSFNNFLTLFFTFYLDVFVLFYALFILIEFSVFFSEYKMSIMYLGIILNFAGLSSFLSDSTGLIYGILIIISITADSIIGICLLYLLISSDINNSSTLKTKDIPIFK